MSTVNLILSDIDGTLLTSEHTIDSELKATLTQTKHPFVLASARSPKGMFPIVEELGLKDNPIVCYNGALIIKKNDKAYDILSQHALIKNDIYVLLEKIESQFPDVSVSLYSHDEWLIEKDDYWVQQEADITKQKPTKTVFKTFLAEPMTQVHKLLLISDAKEINELLLTLKAMSFEDFSCYLSKDNYLEITTNSVSKENALKEIAAYYHVPIEETMAIGDNYNDILMIQLAGVGVAMGNAPEDVKLASDWITSDNNHNGLSRAINQCFK